MTEFLAYIKGVFVTYKIRLLIALGLALVLAAMYYLIEDNGAQKERSAIATVEVEANKEGVKTGAKIEQRVISYSDDDLDRRLARFMRD